MDSGHTAATVAEAKAAAAYALDVPAADLEGYVVIGLTSGGRYFTASSLPSKIMLVHVLADAAASVSLVLARNLPQDLIT